MSIADVNFEILVRASESLTEEENDEFWRALEEVEGVVNDALSLMQDMRIEDAYGRLQTLRSELWTWRHA